MIISQLLFLSEYLSLLLLFSEFCDYILINLPSHQNLYHCISKLTSLASPFQSSAIQFLCIISLVKSYGVTVVVHSSYFLNCYYICAPLKFCTLPQVLGTHTSCLCIYILDMLHFTKGVWKSCLNEIAISCSRKTSPWSIYGRVDFSPF